MPEPLIQTVGLIHTVGALSPVFAGLASDLMPAVALKEIVDETLLQETIASNGVTPEIEARLFGRVKELAEAGVDAVMVTCSSVGQAVDRIAQQVNIPVLRVDQAMVDRAVARGNRVGVLATLTTTMVPTVDLVKRRAALASRSVEVIGQMCEGAFEALKAGNTGRHDDLVRAGLRSLEGRVDVVVLAQASMARVALEPGATNSIPILASPRASIELLLATVVDRQASASNEDGSTL